MDKFDTFLKRKCSGELNNFKSAGRRQKATEGDDHRVPSFVKKNSCTTWRQVKSILEKVVLSLSECTIKRCLHEYKYRGFITRQNKKTKLVTFRNSGFTQVCRASNEIVSLVVIVIIAARSIRMNSEAYRTTVCSHSAKCYKTNRIVLHSADG